MGYQTKYNLSVFNSVEDISKILSNVTQDEFGGLYYAIDAYGVCCDSVKWYEHEADMKKLSIRFPDVVFALRGEGEESGDMWDKYFKNGKMQACYARISFDDYDESKLR